MAAIVLIVLTHSKIVRHWWRERAIISIYGFRQSPPKLTGKIYFLKKVLESNPSLLLIYLILGPHVMLGMQVNLLRDYVNCVHTWYYAILTSWTSFQGWVTSNVHFLNNNEWKILIFTHKAKIKIHQTYKQQAHMVNVCSPSSSFLQWGRRAEAAVLLQGYNLNEV